MTTVTGRLTEVERIAQVVKGYREALDALREHRYPPSPVIHSLLPNKGLENQIEWVEERLAYWTMIYIKVLERDA